MRIRPIAAAALLAVTLFSAHTHGAFARRHYVPAAPPPSAPADVVVWVNLTTGVYHYPGERWYGRTKNGAYLSEAEALRRGYRATRNGQ